jgi:YaiO family outer membrane protein
MTGRRGVPVKGWRRFYGSALLSGAVLFPLFFPVVVFPSDIVVPNTFSSPAPVQSPERDVPRRAVRVTPSYEYGWVTQAGRKGSWRVHGATVSYHGARSIVPYLAMEEWERFREDDRTYSAGAYAVFDDLSVWQGEVGFGSDADYVYRRRILLGYERPLAASWHWLASLRYSAYPHNDTYLVSPGIVKYFGDDHIMAVLNGSFTESRDSAASLTLKGRRSITRSLRVTGGYALGQRLFDIVELPAPKQYGYIGFAGLEYQLSPGSLLRAGFSYAKERPSFIKRGVDVSCTFSF